MFRLYPFHRYELCPGCRAWFDACCIGVSRPWAKRLYWWHRWCLQTEEAILAMRAHATGELPIADDGNGT